MSTAISCAASDLRVFSWPTLSLTGHPTQLCWLSTHGACGRNFTLLDDILKLIVCEQLSCSAKIQQSLDAERRKGIPDEKASPTRSTVMRPMTIITRSKPVSTIKLGGQIYCSFFVAAIRCSRLVRWRGSRTPLACDYEIYLFSCSLKGSTTTHSDICDFCVSLEVTILGFVTDLSSSIIIIMLYSWWNAIDVGVKTQGRLIVM